MKDNESKNWKKKTKKFGASVYRESEKSLKALRDFGSTLETIEFEDERITKIFGNCLAGHELDVSDCGIHGF